MDNKRPLDVIILAAGKGKRMQSELPKVMHLLRGRPLIDWVVSSVEQIGISGKPVVVVSSEHQLVQDFLQDRAEYAVQKEQLGTGHAVLSAAGLCEGRSDRVLVLYGDMPFLTEETIKKLVDLSQKEKSAVALITVKVPDFSDWRAAFIGFGRIIRNENGQIERIAEKKDLSPKEEEILELNTSFFCFDAEWLWPHLRMLKNENAQSEYYLTDLVGMALQEGKKIVSFQTDPKEALGINSRDDLSKAQDL